MRNKTDFLMQMAANIRKHRELKQFSQESFAKHLKIARRNYADIEKGYVNPSILLLLKISLGLQVSFASLVPADFLLEELRNDE